jgi:hypothetical protein
MAATKKSKPVDHTIDRRHRDNADAADRMTGAKPSSIKVVRVRIADIAIPEKSRSIRQDTVDALAASMEQIRLRTPISVRNSQKGIQLVAGRHRLEAAKKLGWKRIDAIVMRDDKLDRRIWHNAENLDRADLTALERAEAVAKMILARQTCFCGALRSPTIASSQWQFSVTFTINPALMTRA